VIASDPNDEWHWEEELPRRPSWREMLIAEIAGFPIGFLQIIDPAEEESHYWGDVEAHLRAIDIWIGEAEYLGRGYGTEMMRLAIARCFADPRVTAILVDPLASNVDAIRFYSRLGFARVESRRFGDDDCEVYRLEAPDRIAPVQRDEAPRLLEVWERSVRATHHFLGEPDIDFLRPLIVDALFGLERLVGIRDGSGELVAFLGTEGKKLEALFVDPAWFRGGLGARLTRHAIDTLGVTDVDVNEQNPGAVAFYHRQGFHVIGRSALDSTGRPFPILHLSLDAPSPT
jgi:aminoglycoside 6'-N-acetyltransferase